MVNDKLVRDLELDGHAITQDGVPYFGGGGAAPSDDPPEDIGVAADEGTSSLYSRGDHVHGLDDYVVTAAKIADATITNGKLRDSTALSVIGRAGATSGAPGDIAAAANGQYLQRNGNAVAFAGIAAADLPAATDSVQGALSPADKTKLDALPATSVGTTRSVIAGTGLTGGGDLSADRTFNVAGHADGSIVANANDIQVGVLATDAQHGARGGGTQHADVVAAGAAGFMTGADKTKLDGLPSAAVATTRQVIAGAGLTGGGALTADVTLDVAANADGSIVVAANDIKVGILATDAQHGTRAGGSLHANVIASGAAGFMSGTDKARLDALKSGGLVHIETKLALAAAVTTLTFNTGISDSLTTGRYLLMGRFRNATVGSVSYKVTFNGGTNVSRGLRIFGSGGATYNEDNSTNLLSMATTRFGFFSAHMWLKRDASTATTRQIWTEETVTASAGTTFIARRGLEWDGGTTEVTSIEVTADTASGIGILSELSLFYFANA
jgi:hypothetical protein